MRNSTLSSIFALSPRGSLCLAVTLACVQALSASVRADDAAIQAKANDVRAAVVLNLAKFVTGPPERFLPDGDRFHIGVMGSPELIRAFEAIEGKTVGGKTIEISPLEGTPPSKYFQILYAGPEHDMAFMQWLKTCPNPHVLTICENPAPGDRNSIIVLSETSGHMALTVYRERAERAGLTVSSKLLKLSTVVDKDLP